MPDKKGKATTQAPEEIAEDFTETKALPPELRPLEMNPEEKFKAIARLKNNLELNFIELGQLLSEVKRTNLFRLKGYNSFKDFIENEFQLGSSLSSKLIGVYDTYIHEMDIDEKQVIAIGMDKLTMIKPFVQKATYSEQEHWLNKAQNTATVDLREEIKEIRETKRNREKTMKDILIEQHREKMLAFFNCSQKELNYKFALYFLDMDLEEMKKIVREKQIRFEEQLEPKN